MTLLIVDDNDGVRKLLRGMMQPLFETIDECIDGQDAVNTYEQRPYDVVIMDVQMPNLDGIDATKVIIEKHPDARIFLVTAYDDLEYKRRASGSGALAFCMKDDILALHSLLHAMIEAELESV